MRKGKTNQIFLGTNGFLRAHFLQIVWKSYLGDILKRAQRLSAVCNLFSASRKTNSPILGLGFCPVFPYVLASRLRCGRCLSWLLLQTALAPGPTVSNKAELRTGSSIFNKIVTFRGKKKAAKYRAAREILPPISCVSNLIFSFIP